VDATTDQLHHVLVSDERDSREHNTIFAREGTMISDPAAQTVTLQLRDGFIHTTDTTGDAEYQTNFQTYDVNLDLQQVFAGAPRRGPDPKELTLGQLRQVIASKRAEGTPLGPELVAFHRDFSIPFACVVFGLVAIPLGVQPVRAARSRGFAVSLAMIFAYYVLLSAGQALAEQELVPAVFALWLPNVVFAAVGVYLFRQAARERSLVPLERLTSALAALRDRLAAWPGPEASS
jgi:lipopolysaccharide export system permease protein